MNSTTTILIIVAFLVLYVIGVYNRFQTTITRIRASIQEIGNQLKRQMDLIPNLEASVKGYLKHEQTIFKRLTDARKQVSTALKTNELQKIVEAASAVSQVLPSLRIAVEDNPELKAEATVSRLMDELRDTSDKVMYARRTLIDLTADYNRMLITVPSNFVGKIFGFKEQPGLKTPEEGEFKEVSASETRTPKVSL